MRVVWAGVTMPPDVYVGRTVCGAGKLKTWDGGREIMIFDAVPIPKGRAAMQDFMDLCDETCADPTDWAPELLAKRDFSG